MAPEDLAKVAGLPEDLGIGEDLARAQQEVRVRTETRTYGKTVTIVEGFDGSIDVDELASTLKKKMATGGTAADDRIELQGDHVRRLKDVLVEQGFTVV